MTTPEARNERPESVREDQGYGIPYDPSSMTVDQALQLHGQDIGGPDAARVATRAKDTQFFDRSLGQPDGTQDVVKPPRDALAATESWADRNSEVIDDLQRQIDSAREREDLKAAAILVARLERQKRVRRDITERIGRLSGIVSPSEDEDVNKQG